MARRGATPAADHAGAAHQKPTTGRVTLSQALAHLRQAPVGACASSSQAEACCGKTGRRDLCRGRWVTSVPTATMTKGQQEDPTRFALRHIFLASYGATHFSP
jgi:hypothetical protein